MIDAKQLALTLRNKQQQQHAQTIREKRERMVETMNAARLRYDDLEESLKQQGRELDMMVGALQAYDEILAELETT